MNSTLHRIAAVWLPGSAYIAPLLVALAPLMGLSGSAQLQVIQIALLTMVVSGLNLCFGYGGELALGQIAIYAAGAYVAGYISVHVTPDIAVGILAGAAAGVIVGLVTGIPGLRLGGWSFAMVSFFLVLLVPDLVSILARYTGGSEGLIGIRAPTLFGLVLDHRQFYLVVVGVAALWLLALRNLVESRFGRALLIVKQSPILAPSVGISVFRTRLSAYMIGAIPAGVAGALYSAQQQFLSPDSFTFALGIAILAASVIGGKRSVYGAVIGAALLQLGPLRTGSFQNYSTIIYGVFLLASGLLFPEGVIGVLRRMRDRYMQVPARPVVSKPDLEPLSFHGLPLEVQDVRKAFDGRRALEGISMRAEPGRVTSIIGPNGSGKTTLLNLVSGYYRPDAGTVTLGGHEIHSVRTLDAAGQGVARTFQTPIIVPELTTRDLVAAGGIARSKVGLLSTVFRLPKYRQVTETDGLRADAALARVGVESCSDRPSSSLPMGSRRLMELARAIASEAGVVLLDEVASGVDEDAVTDLARLVREFAEAGATVVLVEHNFRLVLEVSDVIVVLANGRVVASGTPAEIAVHPDVIQEYLGTTLPDKRSPSMTGESDR